jgi:hypothetical protein
MSRPQITRLSDIVIPSDATIEELVALGQYDRTSANAQAFITSANFPVTVAGPRPLSLICFGREVNAGYVVKITKQKRCSVALAEDLLCVGAHQRYWRLPLQFPVIALGSSVDVPNKGSQVLSLSRWDDHRMLDLDFYGSSWGSTCRFLLVNNGSSNI